MDFEINEPAIAFPKSNNVWTYNLNSESEFIIGALAVGDKYFDEWLQHASASWMHYANRFNIAIIVFRDEICSKESESWRPIPWQKLLVPSAVVQLTGRDQRVLVLDPDILISPIAPNVFDRSVTGLISVVSQSERLPFPLEEVKRRIAFLRNKMYDSKYPLDSLLFSSVQDIYLRSGFDPQPDYFCGGFMMLDTREHASTMNDWYAAIPPAAKRENSEDLSWGEEIYINYVIQASGLAHWLEYEFQAIWIYEMGWRYPFLYGREEDTELVRNCIEATLWSCHFLHFAGSWNDSNLWKKCEVFPGPKDLSLIQEFGTYRQKPVFGVPVGRVLPSMVANGEGLKQSDSNSPKWEYP